MTWGFRWPISSQGCLNLHYRISLLCLIQRTIPQYFRLLVLTALLIKQILLTSVLRTERKAVRLRRRQVWINSFASAELTWLCWIWEPLWFESICVLVLDTLTALAHLKHCFSGRFQLQLQAFVCTLAKGDHYRSWFSQKGFCRRATPWTSCSRLSTLFPAIWTSIGPTNTTSRSLHGRLHSYAWQSSRCTDKSPAK